MLSTIRSLLVGWCLLFTLPLAATDFDTAFAAYEAGEYRTAYRGFKRMAHDHHVQAQYLLGLLYFNGQGVRKDVQRGVEWLKEAAGNGSYRAAAELGHIYATGNGVRMDADEASRWIDLSVELAGEGDADEECD